MTNAEKYNVEKDENKLYPCPLFMNLKNCLEIGDCNICCEWWDKEYTEEPVK